MEDGPSLHVGCPMWANRDWVGHALPAGTPVGGELAAYARSLNAVEGNATFYARPRPETVARWAAAVGDDFRFVFKLPRDITHDRMLRGDVADAVAFVALLEPLEANIDVLAVQLPAAFGPDDLPALDAFLARLGSVARFTVEVRHHRFFEDADSERRLNDLLFDRGADRTILDSRALFAGPCETPEERDAFASKPQVPARAVATGVHPVVRFIGQNDAGANPRFWQPWVDTVVRWLADGRSPTVFIHTPDNRDAPSLARAFHAEVAARSPALRPLPDPPSAATLFD